MKVINKIVLGATIVAVVTNPLSGQVILEGLERGFELIFQYGSPINLIASLIVMAYIGFKLWEGRDKPKIPTKAHKASVKASQYIS